jgi:hypothetical protein
MTMGSGKLEIKMVSSKFIWKEGDRKIIRAALSTHFPPPIDGGNKYPSFPTSYTELPFS